MRIDKFLKVTRIIKRRSASKEFIDSKRVLLNGNIAKPSTIVSIGDTLTIKFGNKTILIEVVKIIDSTKKEDSLKMYKILEEREMIEWRKYFYSPFAL